MKQMVLPLSLSLSVENLNSTVFDLTLCFLIYIYRAGKKEKGLVKTSKASKDTFESKTNRTLLVRSFFFFFLFFVLNFNLGLIC